MAPQTEFNHPFAQHRRVMHISLEESLAAMYYFTVVARQCPSPATLWIKTDSTVTEPVRQVLSQLARGALSGSRVCARSNQSSGRTVEDNKDTTVQVTTAPSEGISWKRCGPGWDSRPPSMPSRTTTIVTSLFVGPTSYRLTRPEQTQWHKFGTDGNCCTSTLHGR